MDYLCRFNRKLLCSSSGHFFEGKKMKTFHIYMYVYIRSLNDELHVEKHFLDSICIDVFMIYTSTKQTEVCQYLAPAGRTLCQTKEQIDHQNIKHAWSWRSQFAWAGNSYLVQPLQDSSIYMSHVIRNEWSYMHMELRWAPNIHISMGKPKWGNTGRQVPCLHARTGATTCNHLSMHVCCCSPAATFGQVRSTSNHINQ